MRVDTMRCWASSPTTEPTPSSCTKAVCGYSRAPSMPGWPWFVHLSASTRYAADPTFKYQVAEVEDCLRRGADAVSVHVNIGSLTEDRQLRDMAGVADACDRFGLPLLAMLYPRGPGIKDHPQLETLLHAAALAVDLGADIVKLPLQGPVAAMKRVVDSCPIPILAAGGAQVSDHQFGAFVADAMASGARGLAAGRNIFMAADPGAKVREVRRLLSAAVAFNRADTPPLADAAGDRMAFPTNGGAATQEHV